MSDITENELVTALQNALLENIDNRPPGYRTREELQETLNMSEYRLLQRLRTLKKQGRLESLRVSVENITGSMGSRPAYRLKDGE
jgi:hypothetical protein